MTTLDRMFLVSYFRSYLIVLTSLLSLYVVIDLFTNIDSFGRQGGGFASMIQHVVGYYGYRISQIFDLMAEGITLFAAMFTVAWLQKNNELLPQLSAGIPTRRVLRPVLLGCAITLSFGTLNQEFVVPRIADQLSVQRDDPDGAQAIVMAGAYDSSGVHIEGAAGVRKDKKILKFCATFPDAPPTGMFHLTAEDGIFIPANGTELSGGWLLKGCEPRTIDGPLPDNLKMIDPGRFFLSTPEMTFDAVARGSSWFLYASTPHLKELLSRPEPRRQSKVAVMFHMRITRPIIGGLLVLLGLAVILQNPNRHMILSAGMCLVFCSWFYGSVLACKALGENDFVSPPLAAWLPVLIFGPITLVTFDSIHT
jgi:lipopolysaccharide export system permease protein